MLKVPMVERINQPLEESKNLNRTDKLPTLLAVGAAEESSESVMKVAHDLRKNAPSLGDLTEEFLLNALVSFGLDDQDQAGIPSKVNMKGWQAVTAFVFWRMTDWLDEDGKIIDSIEDDRSYNEIELLKQWMNTALPTFATGTLTQEAPLQDS